MGGWRTRRKGAEMSRLEKISITGLYQKRFISGKMVITLENALRVFKAGEPSASR